MLRNFAYSRLLHLKKIPFLLQLSVSGFSGNIQFDSSGYRRNYSIDIVHISRLAVMKVDGLWNDSHGLHIFSEAKEVEAVTEFQEKPIEVVTILVSIQTKRYLRLIVISIHLVWWTNATLADRRLRLLVFSAGLENN